MSVDYATFIDRKAQSGTGSGFDTLWMPDAAFPFQQSVAPTLFNMNEDLEEVEA